MTESLGDILNSIRTIAPKLNQAANAAQAVVARVETFLNDECSLGLPVEVEVEGTRICNPNEGDDRDLVEWTTLAYCRADGRFRIAVVVETQREEVDGPNTVVSKEVTAWASAPRDLKLQTFAKLPHLLKVIAAKGEEAVTGTQTTIETAEKVLAALRNAER